MVAELGGSESAEVQRCSAFHGDAALAYGAAAAVKGDGHGVFKAAELVASLLKIVKLQSVFGGGVVSSAGGVRRDRGAVLRKNIQLAAQPGQAQTDPGAF